MQGEIPQAACGGEYRSLKAWWRWKSPKVEREEYDDKRESKDLKFEGMSFTQMFGWIAIWLNCFNRFLEYFTNFISLQASREGGESEKKKRDLNNEFVWAVDLNMATHPLIQKTFSITDLWASAMGKRLSNEVGGILQTSTCNSGRVEAVNRFGSAHDSSQPGFVKSRALKIQRSRSGTPSGFPACHWYLLPLFYGYLKRAT